MSKKVGHIKKQDVYNVVLSIMGGLILVWCLFLFLPMDSYFNFVDGIYGSSGTSVAAYYSTVISFTIIAFSFGFYGIKRCLAPSVQKKVEA